MKFLFEIDDIYMRKKNMRVGRVISRLTFIGRMALIGLGATSLLSGCNECKESKILSSSSDASTPKAMPFTRITANSGDLYRITMKRYGFALGNYDLGCRRVDIQVAIDRSRVKDVMITNANRRKFFRSHGYSAGDFAGVRRAVFYRFSFKREEGAVDLDFNGKEQKNTIRIYVEYLNGGRRYFEIGDVMQF
jgi:hypothetical protein